MNEQAIQEKMNVAFTNAVVRGEVGEVGEVGEEEIYQYVAREFGNARAIIQSVTARFVDGKINTEDWYIQVTAAILQGVYFDHAFKNRAWVKYGEDYLSPLLTPGDREQIKARHTAECEKLMAIAKQMAGGKFSSKAEIDKALGKLWRKWG